MAQPTQEQLRQLVVEEVTEMCIRLMHQGFTLMEIEQVAYEHFKNRAEPPRRKTPNDYIHRRWGI